MSTKGSMSKAQRRQTTHRTALKAAALLFSEFGFEGTPLDSIAAKSGVTKQNIIYYFGSKEGLWEATLDFVFGKVEDSFDELLAKARVNDELSIEAAIIAYFEVCQRNPAYVLIPHIEGTAETWRSEMIAERYLRSHTTRFDQYIQECILRGEIAPIDPLHLQNLLAGGTLLFIAQAPLWRLARNIDTSSKNFLLGYARTVISLLKKEIVPFAHRPNQMG